MVKKSPEFDYRGLPEGSLFGSEHTDVPVIYPGRHQRDALPGEIEAREQVFDAKDKQAQTNPQMDRDAAGITHHGPDIERLEVADITRKAAKASQSIHKIKPRRGRTIGDGIQSVAAPKDIRIPRYRTPSEIQAAKQAHEDAKEDFPLPPAA